MTDATDVTPRLAAWRRWTDAPLIVLAVGSPTYGDLWPGGEDGICAVIDAGHREVVCEMRARGVLKPV